MKQEELLKYIAQTGYNVGFGAKKHFATYDIVEKVPGLIGFVSIAIGIYALVFDYLAKDFISALFLVLGVVGLYINFWDSKKLVYEKTGTKLIQLFNELEKLYLETKSANPDSLSEIETKVGDIQSQYYGSALSKQILFSNWYAHYKFFWEHQITWLDEQLHFKLFRDKIPLSLTYWVIAILLTIAHSYLWNCSSIPHFICTKH